MLTREQAVEIMKSGKGITVEVECLVMDGPIEIYVEGNRVGTARAGKRGYNAMLQQYQNSLVAREFLTRGGVAVDLM